MRRLHRDAEARIRFVGALHVLALMPVFLVLSVLVLQAALGGRPSDQNCAGPRHNRRAGRARRMACGRVSRPPAAPDLVTLGGPRGSIVTAMIAVAALVGLLAVGRESGWPDHVEAHFDLGLWFSGVIALSAYVAWIVLSRKTSILFTASHREVVDRTPHLDPRKAFGFVRASQRTLQLKLQVADDRISQVAFRFPTARECKHWAGRLAALVGRPDDPDAIGGEAAPSDATTVVLLRQRPTARYQLLGTVEAKAGKRRTAEAGLEVPRRDDGG